MSSITAAAVRVRDARQARLQAFGDANRDFHALIIRASQNRHLPGLLERTLRGLFACQFRAWLSPPPLADASADHLRILEASASADADAAERETRAHLRRSARTILALRDAAFE